LEIIFIKNKNMSTYLKSPHVTLALEVILKKAIYDNKMELINPSKEYSEAEIIYMKGYIQSLEDTLDECKLLFEEEVESLNQTYWN
jgi:hypothetical protein